MSQITDDVFDLPVPDALAEEFTRQVCTMPPKRNLRLLQLGVDGLGMWRIEAIRSEMYNGYPRVIATLRRVYP